eukprot:1810006-Prymnesium_polylepis.1
MHSEVTAQAKAAVVQGREVARTAALADTGAGRLCTRHAACGAAQVWPRTRCTRCAPRSEAHRWAWG